MNKELDSLSKEFTKTPCSVLRKDLNLYGKNLQQEMAGFAREVEREAKKTKRGKLILVATLVG